MRQRRIFEIRLLQSLSKARSAIAAGGVSPPMARRRLAMAPLASRTPHWRSTSFLRDIGNEGSGLGFAQCCKHDSHLAIALAAIGKKARGCRHSRGPGGAGSAIVSV